MSYQRRLQSRGPYSRACVLVGGKILIFFSLTFCFLPEPTILLYFSEVENSAVLSKCPMQNSLRLPMSWIWLRSEGCALSSNANHTTFSSFYLEMEKKKTEWNFCVHTCGYLLREGIHLISFNNNNKQSNVRKADTHQLWTNIWKLNSNIINYQRERLQTVNFPSPPRPLRLPRVTSLSEASPPQHSHYKDKTTSTIFSQYRHLNQLLTIFQKCPSFHFNNK